MPWPSVSIASSLSLKSFAATPPSLLAKLHTHRRRLVTFPASKTLCAAPIRATRQTDEGLHASSTKFPFLDRFRLPSGEIRTSAELIAGLGPLATGKRLDILTKVVEGRCFSILPIVEGLHDMGNLGAICRSADALGLGAVHCINAESPRYRARKQRNSAGAEKWMDIRLWNSATACIANAKAAGYHIVATHFDSEAVSIHDLDWTRPTAILLGNERAGVSTEALKLADSRAYIPMSGFVSSFNVSVAAALVLYEARRARLAKLGYHSDLSDNEKQVLMAVMLLRQQGRTAEHIEELLERSQEGSLTAGPRLQRDSGRFFL